MKFFLFGIFLFVCSGVSAQKISGVIQDNEGRNVEYVNVGIVNGVTGTISNEKGEFKILLADSLNHRIIRFSRLGFKPYELTVSNFKRAFSGVVTMERDVMKIDDIQVQAFASKKATFKEVMINRRGMRLPTGAILLQEVPKITVNWVSDPKFGYQYGVVTESDKKYIPQRMEIPVLDCLTDSIVLRVNIYDIDRSGNVANLLNRDEIFLTVRKKENKKNYTIDLSSQGLSLKGKHYFAIEVVQYSYLLGEDGMIIKFPLYLAPSYFRKGSQGVFERFPYNSGIKIWALVEK